MAAPAGTLVDQFAHVVNGRDLLVTIVDDTTQNQRFVVARGRKTGRERCFGVDADATHDEVRALCGEESPPPDTEARVRARLLMKVAVERWARSSRAGFFLGWRRRIRSGLLDEEVQGGKIRVRCVTWNQQAKDIMDVSALRTSLLAPDRFHLVHVGAQECERSILNSAVHPRKREWTATLQSCLGPSYAIVASHALQATHGVVFAHATLRPYVCDVRSAAVATGLGVEGAKLGNKGGVGIRVRAGGVDLCFVASHLCAHQAKILERNREFHAISSGLARALAPGFVDDALEGGDRLTKAFDCVMWSGDLNYRVDLERTEADAALAEHALDRLQHKDQLAAAMATGAAFAHYAEAPIRFPPTYKFDRNCDVYDTSEKRRVPSWTDRVLVAAAGGRAQILDYDSVRDLRWSDHRPVAATVALTIDPERRAPAGAPPAGGSEKSEVCRVM